MKLMNSMNFFAKTLCSKFGCNPLASKCQLFTLLSSTLSIFNYMIGLAKLLTDKDASL